MNCLYCGKEIKERALDMEKKNAWHNRCVKSFFGTKTLPKLDLSPKQMEDFCQLSHRMTQDKYKGSYENCARVIKKYSSHRSLDLSELFLRIVFSYIIGNSDMHLKNFSLREMEPASWKFCLSEAYDMLPVSIILPEDRDQMAFTLNGKKRNQHFSGSG